MMVRLSGCSAINFGAQFHCTAADRFSGNGEFCGARPGEKDSTLLQQVFRQVYFGLPLSPHQKKLAVFLADLDMVVEAVIFLSDIHTSKPLLKV